MYGAGQGRGAGCSSSMAAVICYCCYCCCVCCCCCCCAQLGAAPRRSALPCCSLAGLNPAKAQHQAGGYGCGWVAYVRKNNVLNYFSVRTELFFHTYGITFPYIRNYVFVPNCTYGIISPYVRNCFFVCTELFFRMYGIDFAYVRNYFSVRTELFSVRNFGGWGGASMVASPCKTTRSTFSVISF